MKRIVTSLWGQRVGLTPGSPPVQSYLIPAGGVITGIWGNQLTLEDNYHVGHWDDFVGSSLLGTWAVAKGTDAADANFAISAGLSGVALGTTGATTTSMAGSGIQISGQLNFEAKGAQGVGYTNDLEFNARIQLSSIAGICVFVGLTAQVAALQMPIQGTGGGNALTVNQNNCVGFLYDTNMTTTDWWCVGADGGAAATAIDCGSGPTAATWDQFQISIDQNGNANFFRTSGGSVLGDPVQMGLPTTMAAAVANNVPLAPVCAAFSRVAASKNVSLDYLGASMLRI